MPPRPGPGRRAGRERRRRVQRRIRRRCAGRRGGLLFATLGQRRQIQWRVLAEARELPGPGVSDRVTGPRAHRSHHQSGRTAVANLRIGISTPGPPQHRDTTYKGRSGRNKCLCLLRLSVIVNTASGQGWGSRFPGESAPSVLCVKLSATKDDDIPRGQSPQRPAGRQEAGHWAEPTTTAGLPFCRWPMCSKEFCCRTVNSVALSLPTSALRSARGGCRVDMPCLGSSTHTLTSP